MIAYPLTHYLPKKDFSIDVKALSHQNALLSLLLTNKDQMEFDLQMALTAYDHDNNIPPGWTQPWNYPQVVQYTGRAVHNPQPAGYSKAELKRFFDLIRNVPDFVNGLLLKAQKSRSVTGVSTRTKKTVNEVAASDALILQETEGMNATMIYLLYFTLFSHSTKLTDIYSQLKCSLPCKIFLVGEAKKVAAQATILFHGTHEANLFSILRNGMSMMGRQGVWMTSDMNTAVPYARSYNKLVLFFEALTHPHYSRCYGGPATVYEMPLHLIQLRAILWIPSAQANNLVTIANNIASYLKSN